MCVYVSVYELGRSRGHDSFHPHHPNTKPTQQDQSDLEPDDELEDEELMDKSAQDQGNPRPAEPTAPGKAALEEVKIQ